MIQIPSSEIFYSTPVDLRNCSIKIAKSIVIKTIQECHTAGIIRKRFLTGNENLEEEQEKILKSFPKWLLESSLRSMVQNCVKHEGSFVVYIVPSDDEEDMNSIMEPNEDLVQYKASKNDIEAQYVLGLMYLGGNGVDEQNTEEALTWLIKAAKQGDVNSQLIVGKLLFEGIGVPRDDKEAFKWFRQAAENDNSEAQYILGQMYLDADGAMRDIEQAVKWLKVSAKQGNPAAQLTIGNLFYEGKVVHQDVKTAIKLFMKAAKQNNIHAQMIMGEMYYKGEGVENSYKKAMYWFKNAAEQDNGDAQFILGQMYAKGKGVKQDFQEALKWFGKAAETGHYEAGIITEALS